MKSSKQKSKSTIKYLLANYEGYEIHLSVPTPLAKERKHYLEYNNDGRKKDYAKGEIKRKYLQFLDSLSLGCTFSQSQLEAKFTLIYKLEIDEIIKQITSIEIVVDTSLATKVRDALKSFYQYKELQQAEGTVSRNSLYGYKHHSKKLERYFHLPQYEKLILGELNPKIWFSYRVDLVNNTYGFGKEKLKNSSVNQHFLYIGQFYRWLIDFNELPIKNHLNKLSKLNESQQGKRFKIISDNLLNEFYGILETYEKYYFTRLYLAALFLYENNIRLSEQVLIRACDIKLEKNSIRIVNNKNKTVRTIIISEKAKELIQIIQSNTVKAGIEITAEMFLIGGHNMFKSGIPHGQKELGVVMRRFRKKYPQFAGRTLYEHKHTSITNQFNNGVDTYKIKERANHSSIKTTEIYLQSNKLVQPYEFVNEKLKPEEN